MGIGGLIRRCVMGYHRLESASLGGDGMEIYLLFHCTLFS